MARDMEQAKELRELVEQSSSSDDDDAPLTSLIRTKKKALKPTAEAEMSSSSEDDLPLSSVVRPSKKRKRESSSSSSSDSDDEEPLSAQLKKRARKTPEKKKKKPVAKKKTPVRSKAKAEKNKIESVCKHICPFSFVGHESLKLQLVQRVLVRWNYCFEWRLPEKTELVGARFVSTSFGQKPPANCVALFGLPGVYIGVKGGVTGEVFDQRPAENRPTFRNMWAKDPFELRDLLVKGITEQLRVVKTLQTDESLLIAALEKELKAVQKLSDKHLKATTKDKFPFDI